MLNLSNLFTRTKKQAAATIVADEPESTISIEQELFNEVYSAQDRLIAEAKDILAKPPKYDEERFRLLEALYNRGFRQSEEAKEYLAIKKSIEDYETSKDKLVKMAEYKQNYPFHKFIDLKTVEAICEKYNLYLTHVNKYTAEIPDKNKKEIVDFRVRRCDAYKLYDVEPKTTRELIDNPRYQAFAPPNVPAAILGFDSSPFQFLQRPFVQIEYNVPDAYFKYNEQLSKEDNLHAKEHWKTARVCGDNLLILAPEHKINMTGLTKIGRILINKDPIVLQVVHYGFLSVSCWGLEASDEMVVNEINN